MGRPLLRWLPALVIAGTLLYTLSVYASLPATMPSHWGVNGRPNGYSPREIGAWVLPAMMVFIWVLSVVLPKVDPKKANYEKFGATYDLVFTAILGFQALIQWAMLNIALGHAVDLNTIVYVGLGSLFAIMGLALPSSRPNWFFGIRTPWTLSDEGVWQRTHRTGGALMVLAGLITIAAALTQPPTIKFAVMLTATLAAGFGSVLVSYLYWRDR
jgi:uncharacterized membrane protein